MPEMSRKLVKAPAADDPDSFIGSKFIQLDMGGVTLMALWNWSKHPDPIIRFPPPDLVLNRRRLWLRRTYLDWKTRMLARKIVGLKPEAPRSAFKPGHAPSKMKRQQPAVATNAPAVTATRPRAKQKPKREVAAAPPP